MVFPENQSYNRYLISNIIILFVLTLTVWLCVVKLFSIASWNYRLMYHYTSSTLYILQLLPYSEVSYAADIQQ